MVKINFEPTITTTIQKCIHANEIACTHYTSERHVDEKMYEKIDEIIATTKAEENIIYYVTYSLERLKRISR